MKTFATVAQCSRRFLSTQIPPTSQHINFHRCYSSALRKRDFASFFYHNELWNNHSRHAEKQKLRHIAHAMSAQSYREAEVLTPRRLFKLYDQLSKSRLTILVVLTAMSGVALSPLPTTVPILLSTAVGTALCSASANTLNQLQEVPYDAQMARTRMRPIVRRAITPLHATGFAVATGIAGPGILWAMVSPVTAAIGALNIGLYAGVYTWLKRKSIVNTWVGAVVGGLPPLMGWTACGGKLLPSAEYPFQFFLPSFLSHQPVDLSLIDNPLSPVALFMLLYSWQFPHFMSFSHQVRASYAQAGYKMLCVLSPPKNALVALRHSLLLVPICSILFPLSGLTTWTFALTSLVPSAMCVRAAWAFWRRGGEKEAKTVWQHSLWYLPVILALTMVHKQGMDWTEWLWKQEDKASKDEELA
ncbi:protoheme IX farnesyltransferase [Hygrophoropsis aurantiaca]|uniref:Protoheme IX farnesyltransferase n=1 Tax=Hygrophoropsis aurantiaca TaxID=72124 RepID=A0ACB8AF47_9AGAM|nr:protoheme IX farnesyltransferase [Hygrophoropsis aurantiaca]